MLVLIAGATGKVGRHLVAKALDHPAGIGPAFDGSRLYRVEENRARCAPWLDSSKARFLLDWGAGL